MRSTDLVGKVVVITGAARGLGLAMSQALIGHGAIVVGLDRFDESSEIEAFKASAKIPSQGRLVPMHVDVTDDRLVTDVIDNIMTSVGPIHGLVNNAAIGMQDIGPVQIPPRKPFYELPVETWLRSIDTNLNGAFIMARHVTPHLVARGEGRIVNILTSFRTMQAQGFSPYGPTKAALEIATRIWAKDVEGTGVTVNAILPGGAADTRMIPATEIIDRSQLVQPQAMAGPIVWLMGSGSSSYNGFRFVAKQFDTDIDPDLAARQAGSVAGFPE
jgi:NAD(P)-dependent dehydrogenase (short-subunit alcohol dehydrogenase family)